jgi:hypothetical protein
MDLRCRKWWFKNALVQKKIGQITLILLRLNFGVRTPDVHISIADPSSEPKEHTWCANRST